MKKNRKACRSYNGYFRYILTNSNTVQITSLKIKFQLFTSTIAICQVLFVKLTASSHLIHDYYSSVRHNLHQRYKPFTSKKVFHTKI